ncbi:MAG: nicotinate phosphoribosyltransferase [Candidatus Micrarchaeota archaeon]|nr:nicotinate phosphoribosyltransferase [Candidatus Micrarchaeota archaeon]MDE1804187.1 nicotinate phosphoribosyltransferase [Candidatus Micrarchaeota archaeon]MDE1846705.1 nicotinate phosphoribosyltransferase [Candidatus Micrarchaeota archaeon]
MKTARDGIDGNVILITDGYKFTHWKQYPPGTTKVHSYFESRGGEYPATLFFGLQYQLMRYLEGKVVTQAKIEEAEEIVALHLGDKAMFNREGWEHILDEHKGKLPLRIRAVPEGTVVPYRNVLMTVENTDPKCYWLPNYMETLLVQVWYPTTVATQSMFMKKSIQKYLEETGTPSLIDFKLHDFGFRGVSSVESAAIGGGAHLVNFRGTDTTAALMFHRSYYDEPMAGFSIPAAEHSTITSWGRENEDKAMRNMLEQFPKGTVAVVSDSYNIFEACRSIWGGKLRNQILSRGGALVIRPDSGDPQKVLLEVLNILAEQFSFSVNDKGYKVLYEKVRLIQGDGIDYRMVGTILETLRQNGWSADNIAFGSGGALLQKLNRDTEKFAFKCSSVTVNGEERNVYKNPITDPGKSSKMGLIKLIREGDEYLTVQQSAPGKDELVKVFEDGKVLIKYPLSEIRRRADEGIKRIPAAIA